LTGPRFTVGLPFYQARLTLPDSVRSVFAQTVHEWEFILVADGSTDGSVGLVKDIADPRVRLIIDSQRRGLSWRLNQIAALARGSILVRMDADDLSHPQRLSWLDDVFRAEPACELATSLCYCLGPKDAIVGLRGHAPAQPNDVGGLLRHGTWIAHPTVATRREWSLANPYDVTFRRGEDLELWCRSIGTTVVRTIDAPLYFYREEGSTRIERYAQGIIANDRVLRRYGPPCLGRGASLELEVKNAVKLPAVGLLVALGQADWLIRRRSLPISEDQRRNAQDALRAVRATRVDGLVDVAH